MPHSLKRNKKLRMYLNSLIKLQHKHFAEPNHSPQGLAFLCKAFQVVLSANLKLDSTRLMTTVFHMRNKSSRAEDTFQKAQLFNLALECLSLMADACRLHARNRLAKDYQSIIIENNIYPPPGRHCIMYLTKSCSTVVTKYMWTYLPTVWSDQIKGLLFRRVTFVG